MLFRVLYGFEYKILCDVESEKKVGGMWKEVRIYLQRECCQGSEVWSILVRGQVIRKRWKGSSTSAGPLGQASA